ncbi:hypothetical protein H6G36_16515 [Anabaena minutissima FACHB-250]|nr:hypothetical protein [Anabaena minutissima FACHB-250]
MTNFALNLQCKQLPSTNWVNYSDSDRLRWAVTPTQINAVLSNYLLLSKIH